MLQSLTVWVCSACTCQLSHRPHPTLSTTNNIVHIQLYMSTPPNQTTNNQPTSFLQELRSNFERIMGLDMGITNMDTQSQKCWHFVINRAFKDSNCFVHYPCWPPSKSISNLLTATEDGHLRLALLCLLSSQDLRRQKTGISDRRLPPSLPRPTTNAGAPGGGSLVPLRRGL